MMERSGVEEKIPKENASNEKMKIIGFCSFCFSQDLVIFCVGSFFFFVGGKILKDLIPNKARYLGTS